MYCQEWIVHVLGYHIDRTVLLYKGEEREEREKAEEEGEVAQLHAGGAEDYCYLFINFSLRISRVSVSNYIGLLGHINKT